MVNVLITCYKYHSDTESTKHSASTKLINTAVEDTVGEGTAAEDTAAEGTVGEDNVAEDTAAADTVAEEIAGEGTRVEDIAGEDIAEEEIVAGDIGRQDIDVEGIVVEDIVAEVAGRIHSVETHMGRYIRDLGVRQVLSKVSSHNLRWFLLQFDGGVPFHKFVGMQPLRTADIFDSEQ